MMTNKAKRKGSLFEHDLVILLNEKIKNSTWKRIPGSGAMGTTLGEAELTADVVGKVDAFPKKIKGECKSGYNSSTNKQVKSFRVMKEWLDKVKIESKANYSFPVLFGKFDNVRDDGVKKITVLDIEDFIYLINYITDLKEELDDVYEELQKRKSKMD
jgi:hypothetical protein